MKFPRFERATIEPEKVRDYLLSTEHTVGQFKAAFFSLLGYSRGHWRRLEVDLRTIARTGRPVSVGSNAFGQKFEVSGILMGPSGRKAAVVTVWIVRPGEDVPRLVTAYPGD